LPGFVIGGSGLLSATVGWFGFRPPLSAASVKGKVVGSRDSNPTDPVLPAGYGMPLQASMPNSQVVARAI
jgi:hypothetical protein